MPTTSPRPRVICHMMASIDGRIVAGEWPISAEGRRQYELIHASYEPDGWLCGRVTMAPFARRLRSDEEVARERTDGEHREDFIATGEHGSFAFAIDPHGRLAWESNDIDGDHVVALLSERVSDEYLAFLRRTGGTAAPRTRSGGTTRRRHAVAALSPRVKNEMNSESSTRRL